MFVGIKSSEWWADGNYKEMVGVLQFYANTHLVGGFNPSAKYDLVKLDHFPKDQVNIKTCSKPPPTCSHYIFHRPFPGY